jgi:hypothetical protein
MRYCGLYILGLCCFLSFSAVAEDLPANPWLQTGNDVWLKTGADTAKDSLSNEQIELIKNINSQIENAHDRLPQIANEAVPVAEKQAAKQIKLPSWGELFSQQDTSNMVNVMYNIKTSSGKKLSAQNTANTQSNTKSSGGDMLKNVSGIGEQYNQAKQTANGYVRKIKSGWHQLEKEAHNSINELQRMMK